MTEVKGLKIYISADMEGISGVATNEQLEQERDYRRFCKLMTEDVNAAISGAFDGGASQVVVCDGHGNMSNILVEELDSRAELITGNNRVMCQMEGLDRSFDGVFFVGYHGREGGSAEAVINHTLAGCVSDIRINGQSVGEIGMNAGVAGFYDVPLLLVTGDEATAQEAKTVIPNVETAVVKYGLDRFSARLLPLSQARQRIRESAKQAVHRHHEISPYYVEGPVTYEIVFQGTNHALMTTTLPTVEQVGPKTIRFTMSDCISAYKHMWACVIIAMSATRGVLGHVNA